MTKNLSKDALAKVWLSLSPALSYSSKEKIISYYSSALSAFENIDRSVLNFVNEKAYKELLEIKRSGLLKIQEALIKNNISIAILGDDNYPDLLSKISDPPDVIFYKGKLTCDEVRSVSVVGSRRETRYGKKQAYEISNELAKNNIVIVSGLAYGIDSAAHLGALDAGGTTIAVLGSGINNIYPKDNKALADRICELGGAVISELPPNAEPLAFHFPIRNRIVSGLSQALLLIEAREKSGTMITVNHALNQGREVFALPGPVDVESSLIPNRLLREGAHVCTKADDIMLDMGWSDNSTQFVQTSLKLDELTRTQEKIYYALSQEPLGLEDLIEKTGLDIASLMAEISYMELIDLIEALPAKRYMLKARP